MAAVRTALGPAKPSCFFRQQILVEELFTVVFTGSSQAAAKVDLLATALAPLGISPRSE
jgi:hypothetical protein